MESIEEMLKRHASAFETGEENGVTAETAAQTMKTALQIINQQKKKIEIQERMLKTQEELMAQMAMNYEKLIGIMLIAFAVFVIVR